MPVCSGVLNLVFGKPSDISEYLIPQPSVRLVTFTGSVPVGKHLSAMAGAHMKPAIVELGGHAPVIMCDDIDPISNAETSAIAKSRNAGQVCVSPTRFFVEDAIYDRFADAFAEKAATIQSRQRPGSGQPDGAACQRSPPSRHGGVGR